MSSRAPRFLVNKCAVYKWLYGSWRTHGIPPRPALFPHGKKVRAERSRSVFLQAIETLSSRSSQRELALAVLDARRLGDQCPRTAAQIFGRFQRELRAGRRPGYFQFVGARQTNSQRWRQHLEQRRARDVAMRRHDGDGAGDGIGRNDSSDAEVKVVGRRIGAIAAGAVE